jgi:hypothetical protein
MMYWVFIETVRSFSFRSHEMIIEGLTGMGIDTGNHHRSKQSAGGMMNLISEVMHQSLITYLVKENKPFSFLSDGSTDSSGNHLLLIYIQTLENGRPVMYFYKCLRTAGETAKLLWKSIEDSIIEDDKLVPGFLNFFKNEAVSFISNGAATMRGTVKYGEIPHGENVLRYFYAFVGGKVESVHCMSHRLQLVYKDAVNKPRNKRLRFLSV